MVEERQRAELDKIVARDLPVPPRGFLDTNLGSWVVTLAIIGVWPIGAFIAIAVHTAGLDGQTSLLVAACIAVPGFFWGLWTMGREPTKAERAHSAAREAAARPYREAAASAVKDEVAAYLRRRPQQVQVEPLGMASASSSPSRHTSAQQPSAGGLRLELPWQPPVPYPNAPPTSPREAELWCADVLAWLGASRARATQSTRDGGIDVLADGWVGQVKHQLTPVAPAALQQLHGVATAEGKRAVFFSRGGYSTASRAFAAKVGMPLLTYDEQGRVSGASPSGRELLAVGVHALERNG